VIALAWPILALLSSPPGGDPEVALSLGSGPVALTPGQRADVARRAASLLTGCAMDSMDSPKVFEGRVPAREWQDARAGQHLYVRLASPVSSRHGRRQISEIVVGFGSDTFIGPELSRHGDEVTAYVKCDGHRSLALMCAPAVRPHLSAGQARACTSFDRIGEPRDAQAEPAGPHPATYAELLRLFDTWRVFEQPPGLAGGIPDYTPATNARRLAELSGWQERLRALDQTGWSIPQRVDLRLVQAEMNGMEYHLRVLQPFARDPAYYASIIAEESDTPSKEGPVIHGAIALYDYPIWPRTRLDEVRPLSDAQAGELTEELRTIRPLLEAAKVNLAASNARDLWLGGVRAFEEQAEALRTLQGRATHPDLRRAIGEALAATDGFRAWLEAEAPRKTGPSGVGKAEYTWYLRNVLLVPLSWEDEVTLLRRELARAHTSLRFEENRNRLRPPLDAPGDAEEYRALQERALPLYLKWLADQQILTMEPWMERALRERLARFVPADSRNFFNQAEHRDPRLLWTHLSHWWDNMRMRTAPHPSPVRRKPLLYNVWMTRAEGMATSMEEWMMHAGLYDDSPRSREIVWIMLITRAARGLGNLFAHANDLSMAEAADVHVEWTPRGWMKRDPLLGFEQHLYLRQPGYGASYVTGGRLMEETIAERGRQLGDRFSIRQVMDEIHAAGMIPASLIYWELTGDDRMVRELDGGRPLPSR
jgi:hypothetical protein